LLHHYLLLLRFKPLDLVEGDLLALQDMTDATSDRAAGGRADQGAAKGLILVNERAGSSAQHAAGEGACFGASGLSAGGATRKRSHQ
jgi:hypothetical protein